MKALVTTILALFFAFIFSPSHAQQCTPDGYSVVFINGVLNKTPEDALLSLNSLRAASGRSDFNGKPISWRLAYNPSRGLFSDVADVIRQKEGELGVPWETILSVYLLISTVESRIGPIPESIRNQLGESALNYIAANLVRDPARTQDFNSNDGDLRKINDFVSSLPANHAIFLVGHSQGALYANLAYDYAVSGVNNSRRRDPSAILVTSFGVAANRIAGDLPNILSSSTDGYITSGTDLVINALRQFSPVLLANVANSPSILEVFPFAGHTTVEVYLNPAYPQLRDQIKNNMELGLGSLSVAVTSPLACRLEISVTGSQDGWTVPGLVVMAGFEQTTKGLFQIFGSPGNTCQTGERGSPIYSAVVPDSATFFGSGSVTGVPSGSLFINRRPCSSFVALEDVPDPAGTQPPKRRIWANATGRAVQFSGFVTFDWEYQLRYDSGNPWDQSGRSCVVGTVPGSGFFGPAFTPTCTSNFVAQP